jgi:hypothetical protein
MRRGLAWRLAMGILTFWSPLFVACLIVWFARSPLAAAVLRGDATTGRRLVPLLLEGGILIALLLFTMAALALTSTVYAVHIVTNPALSERAKVVWSVVNVAIGGLVMPVYWYVYLWREPRPG